MRMVEGRTVFVTPFNKKYGARILKYPSRYGAQNDRGEKPNSHGKALRY